ncbi:tetratricopeptide repeat family protein [Clostridium argentinense CDC 2741]|uniref:Tetratricopeptide repeat family protein n=1 Tax=Clostridium argentinense CDC 2741 TaxID=1418104 RepID=A0A0C1U6X1_9CLOT|nr:helix-turn-helix transcriptional regulator [Clostridium argentinense]ARC84749.1 transcriptional regulator [Clostridium argentinense]KIE47538.1 tetratricopeptide repeat family protein [Clostridium argentinense CDC 2741]
MEILSTGEKIKRARIYKGLTLRDICEEKISVSKMSCIENNKVTAEPWILEYISGKLDLDLKYLMHDVRDQILENIKVFKTYKENNSYSNNYIENVLYNLEYAETYRYYDLACEILHLLFSYHLSKNNFEDLRIIIPRYYDLCQKSNDELFQLKYYMDIAVYLSSNGEYSQAISYYSSVRKRLKELKVEDKSQLIRATYNECAALITMEDFDAAKERCDELVEIVDYSETDILKGDIYHIFSILALHTNDYEKFKDYEEKTLYYYRNDVRRKAMCFHNFALTMFKNNKRSTAKEYMNQAIEQYPKENTEQLCSFLIIAVQTLIENEILDLAQKVTDEVLNYAINLDSTKFIESAYYYKAVILQMQNNYSSSETYMNLSLDALVRYGSKSKIYKRYLEMGEMYHKLGEIAESIKFFNLAMQLEKKM